MAKYTDAYSDVYSVFATPAWVAEGIKTIPDNFTTTGLGNEFIRLSVITGGHFGQINIPASVQGQLIIDIFVPAGEGLKRLAAIADKLDGYLVRQSFTTSSNGTTQFGVSAMNPLGNDPANASLFRGSYSISFNYFGK